MRRDNSDLKLRITFGNCKGKSRTPSQFKCSVDVGKKSYYFSKVLFTDRFRRLNFRLSLLRLVDKLYTVIHKTQKTRTKVLQFCNDW